MSQLDLSFGGYSTQGIKDENQDAFAAWQARDHAVKDKGIAVAIADGVSACTRAKEAANTAVTNFIHDYMQTPASWTVQRAAGQVLNSLNRWCHGQYDYTHGGYSQMLTTLSSVIFKSRCGFMLHVGDSRIYRYSQGNLEQLTRDHSARQGSNIVLTRAIGLEAKLDVDFSRFALNKDEIYVLTTDGVTNFLSSRQIRQHLDSHTNDLEQTAFNIVSAALKAGSDDNTTCLLVKVNDLPAGDAADADAMLDSLRLLPPLEPGHKVDGYRVIEQFFNGTRSSLYKVADEKTGKVYGLKTPTEYFEDDPTHLKGFLREEWIGKHLDNPAVMKVFPRPDNARFIYHICEYVEGITLRQWMIDNPKPAPEKVRRIVKQIIAGLRVFQRNDMVYRDIKPENIMLTDTGEVKIIDFGTVQVKALLETGEQEQEDYPVGSVNYIAPEFLIDNQSDFQSDLFSLGVVVYEMFTGELPYQPFKFKDYIPANVFEYKYRSLKSFRPDLPAWLDICLKKATQPEREKRFNAYSEFETALSNPKELIVSEQTFSPLLERNPVLFWQMICAVLCGVIVWLTWLLNH